MKTTFDGLLNRRVTIEQPEAGYRVAIDTVFLAAAVPARATEKVLDMGCGVGGAMLCLAARVPGVAVTGIDIQNDLIELCRRNIAANKLDGGLEAKCGDVTRHLNTHFLPSDFDHVLMNPPYHDEARHDVSENSIKRTANAGKKSDLLLWLDSAARALKPFGTLTLIHRADQLGDIVNQAGNFFGAMEILPLLPASGEPPKRIILRAYKDKKGPPAHCRPFTLHAADGRYTDAAEGVLRHVQAIDFAVE